MSELDDTVGFQGTRRPRILTLLKFCATTTVTICTLILLRKFPGVPSSWPGYTLSNGSSGDKVRQMQEQLNVIAGAYPAIPKVAVDGIYGPATAASVRKFQSVFGLPETGTVDYRTWYKISEIYVGVSRIAELV